MVLLREYILNAFHVHAVVALQYVHLASAYCISQIAILYALRIS